MDSIFFFFFCSETFLYMNTVSVCSSSYKFKDTAVTLIVAIQCNEFCPVFALHFSDVRSFSPPSR